MLKYPRDFRPLYYDYWYDVAHNIITQVYTFRSPPPMANYREYKSDMVFERIRITCIAINDDIVSRVLIRRI